MTMTSNAKKPIELWETLEAIRAAIHVNHEQFAEMLKLTSNEYQKLFDHQVAPSITHVFNLLEHLDLSYENILTNKIDYKALSSSYHQNKNEVLAEKYQAAAFSRVRTIQNILKYLENFHSWKAAENVIRTFQIPRGILDNPDAPVNIKMIAEIYEYVSKYYVHPSLLSQVGEFSRLANSGGHLDKILSKHNNVKTLYSHVFEELIVHFDENFDYFKGPILKLGIRQKKEVADALEQKHLSNQEGCIIRGGVGASFSGYMGLSHAHVFESKCVHRGDPMCVLEFNLEKPILEQKNNTKQPSEPFLLLQ